MFPIKATALPSKKERAALGLSAVLTSYVPEWKQCSEELNRQEYEKLVKAWKSFKGPVKNLEHFAVCVPIDPEEGYYAVAEFKKGRLECSARPEEEIDPDLLAIVEFAGQRKTVVKIQPNAKCDCGSGKKAKRCCHR